jgi:ferredoxin
MLKHAWVRGPGPVGMVARQHEWLAVNVLLQEAQIDPTQVVLFLVDDAGQFRGRLQAGEDLPKPFPDIETLAANGVTGFAPATLGRLDELMARPPEARWQFWSDQFDRCIRCHACRQACPRCNCEQCFVEKNRPQWFPTAADGPGNFAWHVVRAFHLAGRCVGCGSCESVCPAGIPINLLSAAMARSALKHFGFRAGVAPGEMPLQAAFRAGDAEDFIV